MRAVHPGEVLKDELDELGITPAEFARQIDVPPSRVSRIIAGKRAVTGDTALRFGPGSVPIRSSGSTCRAPMTSASPRKRWGGTLPGCRSGLHDAIGPCRALPCP
ncbi:HigA family addiction module antitoxin [Labrys wisconsinensis]|uniref:HigA family addiction module antitoxin n=1 Tax=Labrys wisconsinensis TaxID=425677 RepID=UPI003520A8DB